MCPVSRCLYVFNIYYHLRLDLSSKSPSSCLQNQSFVMCAIKNIVFFMHRSSSFLSWNDCTLTKELIFSWIIDASENTSGTVILVAYMLWLLSSNLLRVGTQNRPLTSSLLPKRRLFHYS